MTIEIGNQKIGRVGRASRRGGARMATALPIGELDANIFGCPACSRPLGVGTSRCPGCGTRLIAGVKASRAVVFVSVGLFSGMIITGGLAALASATGARPAEVAVAPAPPLVAPTQAPLASTRPAPPERAIPSGAVSALRQSTLLNQRVLSDAGRLTKALAAAEPSSAEIASVLRTLASTASFGAGLAPTIGDWDRAEVVSRDLVAFYAAIGEAADDGLSSSLSSRRAYVAAGERMLEIVGRLELIDAASRSVAESADVALPPLTAPSS